MIGECIKEGLTTALSGTIAHVALEPFSQGGKGDDKLAPRYVRSLTVTCELSTISGATQLVGKISSQNTGEDTIIPEFTMNITADTTATNGRCAAVLAGPWALRKDRNGSNEELTISLTAVGGTAVLDSVSLIFEEDRS